MPSRKTRVFLASPGDMSIERVAMLSVVSAINRDV